QAVASHVHPGAAGRGPGSTGLWRLEHHDQPVTEGAEPVAVDRWRQVPRGGRAVMRLSGLGRAPAIWFLPGGNPFQISAVAEAGGTVHGPPDPRVAAAPADVPSQGRVDRGVVRPGITVKQRDGRQDHSRGAVAALGGSLFGERTLHRMQHPPRANSLDGRDRAADLGRRDLAGSGRLAVDQYGAGAAGALTTARLGTGQAELITERRQKAGGGRDDLGGLIDRESRLPLDDGLFSHGPSLPSNVSDSRQAGTHLLTARPLIEAALADRASAALAGAGQAGTDRGL